MRILCLTHSPRLHSQIRWTSHALARRASAALCATLRRTGIAFRFLCVLLRFAHLARFHLEPPHVPDGPTTQMTGSVRTRTSHTLIALLLRVLWQAPEAKAVAAGGRLLSPRPRARTSAVTLAFHTPPRPHRRLRTPLAPPRERCEGDRDRRLLWAACPPLPTFLGEAAWSRTPSPLREPRTPMAPGREASLPSALEVTGLLASCPPLPSFRDSSRSGCSSSGGSASLSAAKEKPGS